MKMCLVRALWGVDLSSGFQQHIKGWREVGYTALEGSPRFVPDAKAFYRALREEGFAWIPQIFSHMQRGGGTVAEHMQSLRPQMEECLHAGPLFFNGQMGSDHWDFNEAEDFFHGVAEMEREVGVPIFHETHRSRYFGNPWNTAKMLERIPTLKLTADFSHWVCVAERLLDDAQDVMKTASTHSHHLHARVGYEEGPQVPDPRDPAWENHLRAHERWWEMIWEAASKRGDAVVTLTPEFGPPPYLHTLPFSGKPVSDLSEICDWMAKRQKEHFESWQKGQSFLAQA